MPNDVDPEYVVPFVRFAVGIVDCVMFPISQSLERARRLVSGMEGRKRNKGDVPSMVISVWNDVVLFCARR